MTEKKLTLSVVTADVGGLVGHVSGHPDILDTARERLHHAREKGVLCDSTVLRCGDDVALVMTHRGGVNNRKTHELAWNTVVACREAAEELKLHTASGVFHKDAFNGTVRGLGPGVAEMEFVERASEPVVILMINKATSGPFNLPLYKVFADPFNTAGLILDAAMLEGFSFKVVDLASGSSIMLSTPKETHPLLALIGSTSRYIVSEVMRNSDYEVCAAVSAQKISKAPGSMTRQSEPAAIVRCHTGFPAVGEVMEAFAFPHLVRGWLSGAHNGPLMPVPFYEANPTRFDGPPRAIAAGFQVSDGRLIGPHDMFDDPSFDETRRLAGQITEYMRRHGPFEPHRQSEIDLESTNLPHIVEMIRDRFTKQ
ncbi:MAG: fructose 1,6-bisphosphatase [Deltaproteobacteria bacterium]|nr:fructose 1,6-bisphosphatase [Deltaproteobacteria bacterium]